MYLARVIGRVVATTRSPGLDGVAMQWIQPLDEEGQAMGDTLVAAAAISSGPGDLVHFVDGREGALACPEPFVPVDAAIIGFVEEAAIGEIDLAEIEPDTAAARGAIGTRSAPGARGRGGAGGKQG